MLGKRHLSGVRMIFKSIIMIDKIVQSLVEKYKDRSNIGIKKYGTTLHENNHDDFLVHLQQELMDASLYIEKLLSQLKEKDGK